MKKSSLFILLALALSSCVRTYTCTCTDSDGSVKHFKYESFTKNVAKEQCESGDVYTYDSLTVCNLN